MKEIKGSQRGENIKGSMHHQRWRRNVDGTYRYIRVCPFNRSVCRLINVFTQMKAGQRGG